MAVKDRVDGVGGVALLVFVALMGINQVVAKVVTEGMQPVFFAGLRSLAAVPCVWALLALRGRRMVLRRRSLVPGLVLGAVFSAEFALLFWAIDLTTVSHSIVLLYTMPLWSALGAHLLIPGERLTGRRVLGLGLAFAGAAWAILDGGGTGGEASLLGDALALLSSICWASILLIVRVSPLREDPPETQLFWQVLVSAPILIGLAPVFGPLLRAPDWTTWAGLGFHTVAIVTLGFGLWFWLLTVYPAAIVAAFGLLAPIFGVVFAWALLGETVGPGFLGALALVVSGLWLVNRR